MRARAIGAKPVGRLFTGHAANRPERRLSSGSIADAKRLARRLLED